MQCRIDGLLDAPLASRRETVHCWAIDFPLRYATAGTQDDQQCDVAHFFHSCSTWQGNPGTTTSTTGPSFVASNVTSEDEYLSFALAEAMGLNRGLHKCSRLVVESPCRWIGHCTKSIHQRRYGRSSSVCSLVLHVTTHGGQPTIHRPASLRELAKQTMRSVSAMPTVERASRGSAPRRRSSCTRASCRRVPSTRGG